MIIVAYPQYRSVKFGSLRLAPNGEEARHLVPPLSLGFRNKAARHTSSNLNIDMLRLQATVEVSM